MCKIVHNFVRSVNSLLKDEYIRFSTNEDTLIEVAAEFEDQHNMPLCIGVIDGCHISVCPPKKDAVDYFNYKGSYSILLLAVVDAKYRFIYTNVGAPGRNNDAHILRTSPLWNVIESDMFDKISHSVYGVQIPGYLIRDAAFPLMRHLLKPFPEHRQL